MPLDYEDDEQLGGWLYLRSRTVGEDDEQLYYILDEWWYDYINIDIWVVVVDI